MSDDKISGEYAWVAMALSITLYDLVAIKTKKMETMSTALWKSLNHPMKFPVAPIAWAILTYHLFASSNARSSMKSRQPHFKKDYYFHE